MIKLMHKNAIRKDILTVRRSIPKQAKNNADAKILELVLSHLETFNPTCICIYVSLLDEVDTRQLIKALTSTNTVIVIPKIQYGILCLYHIHSLKELQLGTYHILEPTGRENPVLPTTVDCFIVPGIAFDRYGHRIGWGKGYYDMLLQNSPGKKIGLAFSQQILPLLPYESYDIVMDAIVTEKEIINCKEVYGSKKNNKNTES